MTPINVVLINIFFTNLFFPTSTGVLTRFVCEKLKMEKQFANEILEILSRICEVAMGCGLKQNFFKIIELDMDFIPKNYNVYNTRFHSSEDTFFSP